MNKPQVFNFNGAQLRIIEKGEQPWFVLKDVCEALELRAPDVRQRLSDDVVSTHTVEDSKGRPNRASIINEDGLYDVILESRKPEAKTFRKWVTSEVLPAIRKHGGYLTPQKVEEVLLDPDTIIQLATQLKQERAEKEKLVVVVEKQQPLVEFAELYMQSNDSIKVGELAHTLTARGIKIGRQRLFDKLREWKYICKNSTEPTQKATELELFEVVSGVKEKPSGDPFTWRTTYVTPKGQAHIANRLKKEGI